MIQTFGHLEFVLKHGKFRHLREVAEYPNSMKPLTADPTREVANLVREMLRQVLYLLGTVPVWHWTCQVLYLRYRTCHSLEPCSDMMAEVVIYV